MSVTFKFRWSSTDCSLAASANSGIRWVEYLPGASPPDGGLTVDTIKVIVGGSTDDTLAAYMQALDQMRYYAECYRSDATFQYPVWLHAKMDEETGERRAWVRSIEMAWQSDPHAATGHAPAHEVVATLKVERGPWERTVVRTGDTLSETAGAAIVWNYTNSYDPAGDMPARLERLYITSDATGASVSRIWAGFRSANKHGTLANFVPVWECENGTNNASESGITDDAGTDPNGASPGSGSGVFVKLVETDLDWDAGTFYEVLELKMSDISANEEDQWGLFMWLLRAGMSAGSTTWEVQLRWGYTDMADADFVRGEIVEVTTNSWNYYNMGPQKNPLRDLHSITLTLLGGDSDAAYAVQIWARRTSGAANLYLDCLCPVPIDEGGCYSFGFNLAADVVAHWYYFEGPDGSYSAASYESYLTSICPVSADGFRPPIGDGRIVLVHADDASHDLTVGVSGAMQYFERWADLRGGE